MTTGTPRLVRNQIYQLARDERARLMLEVNVEVDADGEAHFTGRRYSVLKANGHKYDEGGGQCQDDIKDIAPALYALWERWHLNHMLAGCEHQRAEGWAERPIDPTKPLEAYGKHCGESHQATWNMLVWVGREEHPCGLLSQPCPTCGYKYGSAWLKEELPADFEQQLDAALSKAAESAA
jgi:hypothetical protein